jgi:hypothetical protein
MADPGFVDLPSTTHFAFSFNQGLDPRAAVALRDALAATAERDFDIMSSWFDGLIPPGVPFNVKINVGDGGATNNNTTDVNLKLGATSDFDLARSTLVAEVVEIFMAAAGTGWQPGDSSGEGLSQASAFTLYPDENRTLDGPRKWLDTSLVSRVPVPIRPDFVGSTDPTDGNFVSFGCALLFIYYLRGQLGFSMKAIVQAPADSLEGVYTNLTQDRGAFPTFLAILNSKFPARTPSNFPGSTNPFPIPTPAVLSAKQFLAANASQGSLGQLTRSNQERGNLRALLNSNRPAALVR